MAPLEQITAPALQELLKDGALAGAWILDPSDGSADELHQRHRVTRARSGGAP